MLRDRLLHNCIKNIQHFIYPSRCLLCGQAGHQGLDLCPGCLADLPWQHQRCRVCGAALPGQGGLCGHCVRRPPPVSASLIPFAYRPPLDRLILGFKFARQLAVAPLLGRLLAESARREQMVLPELLLPVPMHPQRLRERGYNQAHELARVLGGELGLALAPALVSRQRHTAMQSRLSGVERRRNLREAFVVTAGTLPAHVALVDDVVTTGSTVNELARALQDAGVARVDVWACARAGY